MQLGIGAIALSMLAISASASSFFASRSHRLVANTLILTV
jgi:hypothetical protein